MRTAVAPTASRLLNFTSSPSCHGAPHYRGDKRARETEAQRGHAEWRDVRFRPTGALNGARAWLPGALVATPQPVDDRGIDIGSYFESLPQWW
jgi:hypothetical protein